MRYGLLFEIPGSLFGGGGFVGVGDAAGPADRFGAFRLRLEMTGFAPASDAKTVECAGGGASVGAFLSEGFGACSFGAAG
ncbi:MAG TPA: hypothetical protein PKA88_21160 [Polyangiaceae bacterium]|nr:hypothetical protein [Polyangiaceae bacterium]